MHATSDLDTDRIIAMMDAVHDQEPPDPGEGLRERKKRRLRQRISNVATALFLTEGFEEVSVARIAARCEVSEQTVFNHFPTKESMFFDRADDTTRVIAEAIRDRSRGPLATVLLPALIGGTWSHGWPGVAEADALALRRRFAEVAVASPTLRSAPYLALAPFLDATARALAERIVVDPDAPEVRFIATVIAGLVLVRQASFRRRIGQARTLAAFERAVARDVTRALDVAAPSLQAFDRPGGRG
jgi:AcrR family transcriptional regulator